MTLQGRTALVTGGSRGIGRAVCLELARQGAAVAFSYAGNEQAAAETLAALEALGAHAKAIRGDVSDAAAVKALTQQTLDAFLYPGEAIRTPLTCLLFMDGDDDARRTNLWRRFMMECNMPRKNGVISQPILSSGPIHTDMTCFATEDNQIECIRDLRECGINIDNWWMDAGWYYTSLDGKKRPIVEDDYVFLGDWLPRK